MEEHLERDVGKRVGVRRLRRRRNAGRMLELEDRSRWEVQPGNEVFTAHWSPDTDITVVPGSIDDWPFDLINNESGDRVPARYHEPPTHWEVYED